MHKKIFIELAPEINDRLGWYLGTRRRTVWSCLKQFANCVKFQATYEVSKVSLLKPSALFFFKLFRRGKRRKKLHLDLWHFLRSKKIFILKKKYFFLFQKTGQTWPLFVYFCSFHMTNIAQILRMKKVYLGLEPGAAG